MFWFSKNHTYFIGVDVGDETLKMVQLTNDKNDISIIAGGSENRPADVEPGSVDWQRWAIAAIKKLTSNGKFRGRDVIAAMPASEVFIENMRMPKTETPHQTAGTTPAIEAAIFSKIRQKLPFEADDAMIRYIPTEKDNVVVIAAERKKVDRHLAIYEKTNLQIKSISIWPVALANCYTRFFGRRKSDIEAIVMLLDIEPDCTNVVICRHKNILFARSIPIGSKQLDTDEILARLTLELTACRRHFTTMYNKAQIERVIFLSGQTVDRDTCTTIAERLELPAQMGDCLAAVKIVDPCDSGVDRRGCRINWATAFGLSLS